MVVTCMVLWSALILQITLFLPTGAISDNETTNDFALKILSVSATTVNVQWNCTQAKTFTLTWRVGLIKNALEQWQRTDMKVLDYCQNASNIGQLSNTMLRDLEEGFEYGLSITQDQQEDFVPILSFSTLTSVPSGPPINLRGHPVIPATMYISWTRPKLLDCNGDILQYIIMVQSGSDESNYTFNVTKGCVSVTSNNTQCFTHSVNISKNGYTNYSVKVAAVNINGTGPFSSAVTVMSGDDVPGQPENLRVINSDEELDMFILHWDKPRNPNGAILRYKIEYGVTNVTVKNTNYTNFMNYTLKLSRNETYTIAVYAENSVGIGNATVIQWSASDDGSSSNNSTNNLEDYQNVIIIGSSVGAFVLTLLICIIIVCIRSKHKKSSNSSSRSKGGKFYPAGSSNFGTTTVVNLGYVYADRGSNSLPYDYPYVEANGAQASSATTFLPQQRSRKSTYCSSTGTCGYIEVPAQPNDSHKSRPHPANFAVPNSPSNISEQSSIVSPSSSNTTSHKYVNTTHGPSSHVDARTLLSPPLDGTRVDTKANTNSDSSYITLRS